MIDEFNLTPNQLDALLEIGNVGAGNSATALSQIVNKKIDMNVPKVSIIPIEDVPELVGGPDSLIVAVFLRVYGKAPGNILSGSYLGAFSHFTNISMLPSIPSLAMDMAGAILNIVLLQLGQMGDRAMVIETKFIAEDDSINGHFFLVPDPGSLGTIVKAVGVE